jgi:hypothetical protein
MNFTYNLPFTEEKLKNAALDMLRKNNESWAALLDNCKMTVEEHGTSYYFDGAKSSRWDAIAIIIKFSVSSKNVDTLVAFPQNTLKQIFADLIPSEVGYDVKEIKYIPNINEDSEESETIENTLKSIQNSPFVQAVEHYQQAKRQFANAQDERRRKDAVRDCASAMESIIKILGKDDDIRKATKNLREAKIWGQDDIVKDGDAIFNKLHYLYPDFRHGAQQTSKMSVNEAKYWIDRISTYISYMVGEYEDVSWIESL